MDEVRFGVGSFHFRWKGDPDAHPDLYFDAIERLLAGNSNITDVNIIRSNTTTSSDTQFSKYHGERIYDMIGAEILPVDARIDFTLFIPKQKQKALDFHNESLPETEMFSVCIYWDSGLPIAFVSSKSHPNGPENGSSLVPYVCWFLEAIFPEEGAEVYFERLGPSPMHVHFSAKVCEPNDGFKCHYAKTDMGYDHCLLELTPEYVDFFPSTLEAAFDYLLKEATLYYELIQFRNIRNKMEDILDTLIENMTEPLGIFDSAKSFVSGGSSSALFDAEKICYDLAYIDAKIDRTFQSGMETLPLTRNTIALEVPLRKLVADRLLDASFFRAILDALRDRQGVERQIQAGLVAALIGAISGAIVAAIIS